MDLIIMTLATVIEPDVITPTVNEPKVRGWLRTMNSVPSIEGHRYTRQGDGAWCTCGHYCGGLGQCDANPDLRDTRTERYQLHLRLVTNLNNR